MQDFDIPIFSKSYDLYKALYGYRTAIPKQDRYALWQKCENLVLEIIENLLIASQLTKEEKLPKLEKISLELNTLRIFIRLAKEIKAIDNKKYVTLQANLDEIGKMLGGWIKSVKILKQNTPQ